MPKLLFAHFSNSRPAKRNCTVRAWGLINDITFPLLFEVYKPKERLLNGYTYRSKTEIAAQMVREINQIGFEIELVLADSLYGESEWRKQK